MPSDSSQIAHPSEPVADLAGVNTAIIHDWLPTVGGGERVLQQMVNAFPNSTIYTLFDFLTEAERDEISGGRPIVVSRLNRLPGVRRYYRNLLLECTHAIEEFDVTRADLVLSSSAALAKGVITGPDQEHIAYVHSPPRYAWDMTHEYLQGIEGRLAFIKRRLARRMLHKFRIWDMRTVASVTHFVANSHHVARRIRKVYGREADIIYPPVDVEKFALSKGERENFFLAASRHVAYKRFDLLVKVFADRPKDQLLIIGYGPETAKLKSIATPNIKFLGHIPHTQVVSYMQRAKAFLFPAYEDFGIVSIEAQACGTPVIGYGKGGTRETVRGLDNSTPTGVHFDSQSPRAISEAIDLFEQNLGRFDPDVLRQHALSFRPERFRTELQEIVIKNGSIGSDVRR